MWHDAVMSVQGIGNYLTPLTLPSALESGREGISRATDMMVTSAQAVAGVIVDLSDEASSNGVRGTSLDDALLDTQVAEYMALANIRVVTVADSLTGEMMTILGDND
tara:strand:- start:418 stop:738 length:321 start_codon:yes stop_codon:yes gene_type:complete